MEGCTLVISREVNNHSCFKKRLEGIGFPDVVTSDQEKDALNSLIRKLKPCHLIMDARFYQCCTPFLMGRLKRGFPQLEMTAVSIGEYPPEIAMYFILNGVKSYVSTSDGIEDFFFHLAGICKGKRFISPAVIECINLRRDYPEPAGKITDRHKEIIRLICCGFTNEEIAETLAVSRNTVSNHKTEIFTSLNVRSSIELIRAALTIEILRLEELYFYPKDLTVNPLPNKKKIIRRKK